MGTGVNPAGFPEGFTPGFRPLHFFIQQGAKPAEVTLKIPTQSLPPCYPASRIAAALGKSKRTILKALEDVPATSRVSVAGQKTDAWSVGDLPDRLRLALYEQPHKHAGYRDVLHLLDSPPDELPELPAMPQLSWRDIRARLASFKGNAPDEKQLGYLWVDIMDAYDAQVSEGRKAKRVKRELLDWLLANAPFLGATYKAVDLKFSRRLERWQEMGGSPDAVADQRASNSGHRSEFELPETDLELLRARVTELKGNLAKAWRDLIGGRKNPQGEMFSQETRDYYRNRDGNKSYVPGRVRTTLKYNVPLLLQVHQGPRADELNGAYSKRDPKSFCAGDWFQADDVTLEIYFWANDKDGQPIVTRGQCIPMIDVRTFLILGFVLTCTPSYNQFDIRNLIDTVESKYGLPRKGFYFERGLWKRAKLIVGPRAEAVDWDETCMGLRGRLGLRFRHAKSARGKVIERVLGILQSHLSDRAGWASNDERRKLPEKLKGQLAAIDRGEAHPSEFLYSHEEWCRELEKACAAFNWEKQNGDYLPGISPSQGYEKFFGNVGLAHLDADCRYLLASEKHRVKVGRNGITLRYGCQVFNYKSERTGELQGQQVICWFSPGKTELLSVTDLDGKNPFVVARSTLVLDDDPETLQQSKRENAAHNSFRRALYRTTSPHLSAPFVQRMFRQNIADRNTVALGQTMRQQTAAVEQEQKQQASRSRTVHRQAQEMGVPAAILDTQSDEAAAFSRLMVEARRENEREQQGTV